MLIDLFLSLDVMCTSSASGKERVSSLEHKPTSSYKYVMKKASIAIRMVLNPTTDNESRFKAVAALNFPRKSRRFA